MKCSMCDGKISIVIAKTKVRKRSFYTLCEEGHICSKLDSHTSFVRYGIYVGTNQYRNGMLWVNR